MSFGLAFWILMLLGIVLGFFWWRGALGPYGYAGGGLWLFLLLGLLGWRVFGAPLHA